MYKYYSLQSLKTYTTWLLNKLLCSRLKKISKTTTALRIFFTERKQQNCLLLHQRRETRFNMAARMAALHSCSVVCMKPALFKYYFVFLHATSPLPLVLVFVVYINVQRKLRVLKLKKLLWILPECGAVNGTFLRSLSLSELELTMNSVSQICFSMCVTFYKLNASLLLLHIFYKLELSSWAEIFAKTIGLLLRNEGSTSI